MIKTYLQTLNHFCFAFLLFIGAAHTAESDEWRHFYGITWNGTNSDNLKYARHMGYDYIFYHEGMEKDPSAAGFKFYIETPEYHVYPVPRTLDLEKNYSPEEQALYEKYFAWKSTDPFPHNIATGWFFTSTRCSIQPDFQQQEVVEYFVERIIEYAKSLENHDIGFTFGGLTWDVPQFKGDFWSENQGNKRGRQISLEYWTGKDESVLHKGITHEYKTYSEGTAAYYKLLLKRIKEEFPDAKILMEPYNIYQQWIAPIMNRPDSRELMPDMLMQEKYGTEFVDDARIFESGLITKNCMASTTPDESREYESRVIAAKASINGAWFNWYGRFGGSGNMPAYRNIFEIPPRLKLIRMVPNWENLSGIPLSERHWDGEVYSSPNAYVSKDIICSRQPKTVKIFVVFLTDEGVVKLPSGKTVKNIYRTDDFFMESGDGIPDVTISSGTVRLNGNSGIEKGYIIILSE